MWFVSQLATKPFEIASLRTGAGVGLANSGVVCLMGGVHAFSVVGSWSGHDNVLK